MIIKKFQGNTEEEAILAAKEEMGSNAIVMNICTTKQKGIFGMFRKDMVEVTAALEEKEDLLQKEKTFKKKRQQKKNRFYKNQNRKKKKTIKSIKNQKKMLPLRKDWSIFRVCWRIK